MIEPDKTPESEVLIKFIDERIRKRLNCNILVTGNLGSGKSYLGMRLLEKWYAKQFNEKFPAKHICQTFEQAILLAKDFKRKGEGILVEELSVLGGSRESLTKMNRFWNKFMDTIRYKQVVIVFNAPFLHFIDKHMINLCQMWIECLGVNFRKKICVCKPLILQPSQYKLYYHKFIDEDGDEIGMSFFKKPSEELTKTYDELKDNSNMDLYEELAARMMLEKKKQLKELGQKALAPREQEAWDLKLEGVPAKEAYKKMGLSHVNIYYEYIQNAKKKLNLRKKRNFPRKNKENQ
jgi:hypothetical protein